MKNPDKKLTIKVEDLKIFDDFKVAGVMYRVDQIEMIGNVYMIQFHNVRRPVLDGLLTVESNTLMKIRRPA